MQRLNKTTALLRKLGTKEITAESSILSDAGLLELYSWHTSRSPKARLKDTLRVLVKAQLISQGHLDGQTLYSLTTLGKQRIERAETKATVTIPTTWSKRWHFVTYQIPASQKVARNAFILELKKLGFLRYGPALWIYPHDLTSHIQKVTSQLKIANSIEYIRADTISNQKKWQKAFRLS